MDGSKTGKTTKNESYVFGMTALHVCRLYLRLQFIYLSSLFSRTKKIKLSFALSEIFHFDASSFEISRIFEQIQKWSPSRIQQFQEDLFRQVLVTTQNLRPISHSAIGLKLLKAPALIPMPMSPPKSVAWVRRFIISLHSYNFSFSVVHLGL